MTRWKYPRPVYRSPTVQINTAQWWRCFHNWQVPDVAIARCVDKYNTWEYRLLYGCRSLCRQLLSMIWSSPMCSFYLNTHTDTRAGAHAHTLLLLVVVIVIVVVSKQQQARYPISQLTCKVDAVVNKDISCWKQWEKSICLVSCIIKCLILTTYLAGAGYNIIQSH